MKKDNVGAILYNKVKDSMDENIYLNDNAKLSKKLHGLWYKHNDKTIILINRNVKCDYKKAFILAHEIGHDKLHQNINGFLYFKDSEYYKSIEKEANIYGLRILVKLLEQ